MYKVNNELIDDKELALEVAKKYRQLSIFDLNTKKEIILKEYEFIKVYTIYNKLNEVVYQVDNLKELVEYFGKNLNTIKNCIYLNLQENYSQLIDNEYFIIKDYVVVPD